MNTEALKAVMSILDRVDPDKFDVGVWDDGCGCRCAIGWAGMDPWFRRQGFKLVEQDGQIGPVLIKDHVWVAGGWEAVRLFFDLSHADANYLFHPWSYEFGYAAAEDVQARIRRLLEMEGRAWESTVRYADKAVVAAAPPVEQLPWFQQEMMEALGGVHTCGTSAERVLVDEV